MKELFSDDVNIFMVILFLWFVFEFVTPTSFLDQILDGLTLMIIMVYFKIRGII